MEIKAESGTVNAVPDDEQYTELAVYALDENCNTMS
jgi:hypothetical protein